MNDKQQARWEEVREEIAKGEYSRHRLCTWPDWNKLDAEYIKDQYRKYAEETLNLKDSAGNYLIEIADVDQNLPDSYLKLQHIERLISTLPDNGGGDGDRNIAKVQREHTEIMIKRAGFKKCLPRDIKG